MKRCAALVLALWAGLLLLAGTASAATYPLNTTGQGTVDKSVVQVGDCVVFSGTGFAPGTTVTVTDDGTPVATTTTDSGGAFSQRVCYTTAARLGTHLLAGSGTDVSGGTRTVTASVTVVGVSTTRGSALPRTGTDVAALVAVGLLLVVGGSLVLEQARRRRA